MSRHSSQAPWGNPCNSISTTTRPTVRYRHGGTSPKSLWYGNSAQWPLWIEDDYNNCIHGNNPTPGSQTLLPGQTINITIFTLALASTNLISQTLVPAPIGPNASAPIPKHLIYELFLSMINDLDTKATAAGATDIYQFAQPFARAYLENADLDLIRTEAHALIADLKNVAQRAKVLIDDYQTRSKAAANNGQPIPPLPPDLARLEKERTVVSINHIMTMRTSLGPDKTTRLEAYFAREIAPHISLRASATPPLIQTHSHSRQPPVLPFSPNGNARPKKIFSNAINRLQAFLKFPQSPRI